MSVQGRERRGFSLYPQGDVSATGKGRETREIVVRMREKEKALYWYG